MSGSSMSIEEMVRTCAESHSAAEWEEFVRLTHRLIASIALRTARVWGETSTQVVDDLVQEVYLKLCADRRRVLRAVEPGHPGSFFGFLKVMTANVVHDHFKAMHAQRRGSGKQSSDLKTAIVAGLAGEGSVTSMERDILLKQIDNALAGCVTGPDRDRNLQIFWLHYRYGLSAGAIASLPSIALTVKGVESTILRLTRLVRARISSESKDPDSGEGFQVAGSF